MRCGSSRPRSTASTSTSSTSGRARGRVPLIMTHGWPGSVIEMIDSVGPLTDPTAHGGSAEDAFHLALPCLPGYGSRASRSRSAGHGPDRRGLGRAHAPPRLHPLRGPGRRRGRRRQRRDGPPGTEGLIGIHTNLLVRRERHHADGHRRGTRRGGADRHLRAVRKRLLVEMATRPQAIGYACWSRRRGRVDDRPDTDELRTSLAGLRRTGSRGGLTRDHVLDNVTLDGWRAAAPPRPAYWEAYGRTRGRGRQPLPTSDPVGHDVPRRDWRTRAAGSRTHPNVSYFNEADRADFGAWEEPELFAPRCGPRSAITRRAVGDHRRRADGRVTRAQPTPVPIGQLTPVPPRPQ